MSLDLPLNAAQRAAVEHGEGPVLVIAGAGSGKTRVLTARIARLLELGVRPDAILAFTFTNRAAREMRERLARMLGPVAERLWIGTFHATAVRILRREARTLGLPPGFSIYDRDDQEGIVRDLVRELGLPEAAYRVGTVLGRISDAKNALVPAADMARLAATPFETQIAEVARRYEAALRAAGALDFDDLIAESVRLLTEHPDARERWTRRFAHVLVDEYQDTNHAQFRLVEALAGTREDGRPGNLFVVGDDDQSIYGWRGADLANVLDFERAFPGATTLRLEQNYRSVRNILDAANAVIANNAARKGKTLWSEREAGPPLRFALCADEAEEARRIRRFLEARVRRGAPLAGAAVLYRTNAQSRAIETELRGNGIGYEIVGGVSFFQRREVKDVLAYLRLVVNPRDVASFWRVWNTPRRGLGPAVRAQVEARLAAGAADPCEALRALADEGALNRVALAGARALLALLDGLRARTEDPVDELFATLLETSGYLAHLEGASESEVADRRSNVEELGVSAAEFAADGRGSLLDYLSECSLLTDADRVDESRDRVLLLTAHNAKGLEFDAVVIAGLEEGLMPHATARDDVRELEEERRLFYVALTRAREEALLTAAAYRRRFDGAWGAQVSRFVDEIPPALLEREAPARSSHDRGGFRDRGDWGRRRRDEGGLAAGPAVAAPALRSSVARRAVGRTVHHETFGRGTVLDAEGEGESLKLTVRFGGAVKKVFARFVSGGDDGD